MSQTHFSFSAPRKNGLDGSQGTAIIRLSSRFILTAQANSKQIDRHNQLLYIG